MSASLYLNVQVIKVISSLSSVVVLVALQSAHAELIISNSKDANGQAAMLVTDDSQKELPPAQLGICLLYTSPSPRD